MLIQLLSIFRSCLNFEETITFNCLFEKFNFCAFLFINIAVVHILQHVKGLRLLVCFSFGGKNLTECMDFLRLKFVFYLFLFIYVPIYFIFILPVCLPTGKYPQGQSWLGICVEVRVDARRVGTHLWNKIKKTCSKQDVRRRNNHFSSGLWSCGERMLASAVY